MNCLHRTQNRRFFDGVLSNELFRLRIAGEIIFGRLLKLLNLGGRLPEILHFYHALDERESGLIAVDLFLLNFDAKVFISLGIH